MEKTNDSWAFIEYCCNALEGSYGPLFEGIGIITLVLFFTFITRIVLRQLATRFENKNRIWPLTFVRALATPLNYYIWMVAGVSCVDILTVWLLNSHPISMHAIFTIGSVLAFGWFLLRWNNAIVQQMMLKSQKHEIGMTIGKVDLFSKIGTVVIIIFTIFLLMDVTGRNMQTLIAFGGIGGLALAFASQQVVSNFFGGTMVYLTQPFTIGEWVILPEKKIEGHIEEIGWYLTRIRSMEKRPIYVPNSIFSQTIVVTPSRMSHERFRHTIGLRYEDIKAVKDIVGEVKLYLLKHPSIDQHQKVDVYFTGFGDSSLYIELSAYISTTANNCFPAVRQELLLHVAEIVEKHGAQIATPTSIVEIQGGFLNNPLLAAAIKPAVQE